jgi:DNA invertase Pin-like site-specific DNA recombinase
MIIGYARVSTDGQTLDAQQSALRAAGAERIFAEKISGAVTDRKALAKPIAALSSGDLSQFQIAEALVRRGNGEPLADIGRSYGVSHSTISRL